MLNIFREKIENRILKSELFANVQGLPKVEFAPAPSHIDADISLVFALASAKILRQNPMKIAESVCSILSDLTEIKETSFTAPGFVNIKLADEFLVNIARDRRLKDRNIQGTNNNQKILIEFVSANPTGPLHVASGRGASLGDSLVKIYRALGYSCDAEYYVNDAGNQAELLGASLQARAEGKEPPENGYHGLYLIDLAKKIPSDLPKSEYGRFAMEELIKTQQQDMKDFDVEFTRWFRESELHKEDAPKKTLEYLKQVGHVYEKDGAVWFGTTDDNDDKDRVLVINTQEDENER